MTINPVAPKDYLQSQLDDMGFSEMMRLAKFLDEGELHLGDLVSHFHKLEQANNDACMQSIDAEKQTDDYRDLLAQINVLSGKIYG